MKKLWHSSEALNSSTHCQLEHVLVCLSDIPIVSLSCCSMYRPIEDQIRDLDSLRILILHKYDHNSRESSLGVSISLCNYSFSFLVLRNNEDSEERFRRTGSTYAAVAVNISTRVVLASVRNIKPTAKTAVNTAISPIRDPVDCRVARAPMATVGKRQATKVATEEVKRNMRASL